MEREIDRQKADIATAEADIESRNLEIYKHPEVKSSVKENEIEESKKKNKEQEDALEAKQKEIEAEMDDLARKTSDNDIEMEKAGTKRPDDPGKPVEMGGSHHEPELTHEGSGKTGRHFARKYARSP